MSRESMGIARAIPTFMVVNNEGVLMVDDDNTLAALLGETLAAYGYEPKIFTDSSAALAYFKQDPARVDVLITDYAMPVLTGGELAGEILSIRPGMPSIMCTGYTEKMDLAGAKHQGVAHYLLKPVSIVVLLKTLQELLPTPTMSWVNG